MGISRQQALDCFRSDDLVGLGMEADAVRRRLHPEGVVSYAIERRVECAPGASTEAVYQAVAHAEEAGVTGVRLAGLAGADGIERLLRGLKQRFPHIWVEALSAVELHSLAVEWGIGLRETLVRLREAGLGSIAAENADARVGVGAWVAVHRAAHEAGMRTVARISFGAGETPEQRVDCLDAVRRLQEETGGFGAFVPVPMEPASGRALDGVTAVERLKALAIARIFLDSVENVQVSAAGEGLKVLQMGLRFGGNDVGSLDACGASEEDVRRIIRDAGFRPAQRDLGYRALMLS